VISDLALNKKGGAMLQGKYDQYFVTKPEVKYSLKGHNPDTKIIGMTPAQIFLNDEKIKGCPVWFDIVWIYDNVLPAPWVFGHKHDVPEILIFLAADGTGPLGEEKDLGGEVELAMGDEPEIHTITKTTAVYIPANVMHCPLTVKKVDKNKPFYFLAFLMQPSYKSKT
jgi:hypothetical protein